MSVWQLLLKQQGEVVDTKEFKGGNYEIAHSYFRQQKKLESFEFNKLFIVERLLIPKNYKWWEEESINLDIERD